MNSLALEAAIFRYHGTIGELIWFMITFHPEISFPHVKHIQFSTLPVDA